MVRVLGLASSSLLDRDNPLNPTNRRISIIVMNREAEDRFERGGDVEASSAPQVEQAVSGASASETAPAPTEKKGSSLTPVNR